MSEFLENFLACRNPDGGMPYQLGMPSYSEPTLLMVLACKAAGNIKGSASLLAWARKRQNPDGSIGLNGETPREGLWSTPLLAIALHHSGFEIEKKAAMDFILQSRSIPAPRSEEQDLDPTLIGWSWMSGTFGWVEPTAWALLALRFAGLADCPRAREGRRLLLDRCIPGQGWNYGNRRVYGHSLLPFWDTTALALMALEKPEKDTVSKILDVLEQHAAEAQSLLTASWVCCCFHQYGRKTEHLRGQIYAALQAAEIDSLNMAHCAIGLMALSQERILFP